MKIKERTEKEESEEQKVDKKYNVNNLFKIE